MLWKADRSGAGTPQVPWTAVRSGAGTPQVPWTAVRSDRKNWPIGCSSVSRGTLSRDLLFASVCPKEKITHEWVSFLPSRSETEPGTPGRGPSTLSIYLLVHHKAAFIGEPSFRQASSVVFAFIGDSRVMSGTQKRATIG